MHTKLTNLGQYGTEPWSRECGAHYATQIINNVRVEEGDLDVTFKVSCIGKIP
jgi:hypothetical protein